MITVTFQHPNISEVENLIKEITAVGGSVITYDEDTFIDQSDLLAAIEEATGINEEALRSKDRHFNNVSARSIYANVFIINGASRSSIALYLHCNHSSVLHHIKEFPNRLRYDLKFRLLVAKVAFRLDLTERLLGMTPEQCRNEIHKLSSMYDVH